MGRKRYGVKNSLKCIYKEIKSLYDNGNFEGALPEKMKKRKVTRTFIIQNAKFNTKVVFEKLKMEHRWIQQHTLIQGHLQLA